MYQLSDKDKRNVQHFLLENGHACPYFEGEYVIYRDQTVGFHATWVKAPVLPILNVVMGLSTTKIEEFIRYMRFDQEKYNVILPAEPEHTEGEDEE